MVPTPPRPRRAGQDEGFVAQRHELVRAQWNLNFLRGVYIRSQQMDLDRARALVHEAKRQGPRITWPWWRRLRSRIASYVHPPQPTLPAPEFYVDWLSQQPHSERREANGTSEKILLVVVGEDNDQTQRSIQSQTFSPVATLTFANFTDFARGADASITETTPNWISVIRSGDVLSSNALNELLASTTASTAGIIYADEDRCAGALRTSPQLRSPSVGPHTMWSYNAVGYPHLIHIDTWRTFDGLDERFASAAMYEFFLRASASDTSFTHCNRVLLTRDAAQESKGEPDVDDQIRALESHWQQLGVEGRALPGTVPGLVDWTIATSTPPSVDILIPTRDRLDLLAACLSSIEEKTAYPNFHIIILDNDSVEETTVKFLQETKHRVVACPGPFNYAAIINRGVAAATSDVILTLNNDTLITQPHWLSAMVGALSLNDVGVVGNKHVSPQGGVVHAGVVATPDIFNVTYESRPGFDARYELASRDVLAVTGACTAIRRDLWTALGGMNESLEVECNDIDLCLRVLEMGKYILYLSNVEIIHAEKASRGPSLALADNIRFFEMWDLYSGDADPFFSPNYDFAMGRVSCRITVAPSDVTGFFRHEPTEVLGHKE